MSLPNIRTLYDVVEATWPPASITRVGPVTIRDGQGGGKRVSAGTVDGAFTEADLDAAEAAMLALGQYRIFMVREGEDTLDEALEVRGYEIVDPVNVYAAKAEDIATERPPRTAAIPGWEPLRIMEEIWAKGGIGPARINVMQRANGPKTGFVSRWNDQPAGTSFMAMHAGIGMVHAVEILPHQRRQGVGRFLMRRAAFWVLEQGGHTLSVICTQANEGANGLYASLGMTVVGQYHYRQKTKD
ncbi:acetyltransferase (GNAT) family protein [Shimia isoporae]|uniref:Acetyltransferase (GNAT) family protein n=1 Tax=Shimia isoporae TaxID=647720 RepID=A0A4R1N3W7_9RHOB|nr:GNAT family N-acetyltransferase [Shimia isoporae]TCL01235.1 acetyltransferase (GNAT) family protein [Shimia isoporae]